MAAPRAWDAAVKAAEKILGDKAKIPKWPATIDKAMSTDDKSFGEFSKVRDELKQKLLATQNTREALKNATSQFQDEIEESNLGLNPKDKADAKKIADGRKPLMDVLQDAMDTCNTDSKNLKELDKHLMSLMNYKQST
jgi:fumarylacetoacetate (FAA) hydrolase family protein